MSVTTKIIGLASTAVVFAGMAFGQANLTCSSGFLGSPNLTSPAIPIELRSESATELVSDVLGNCAAAPAGSTSGQVTAMLSATGLQSISSKVLSTSNGVIQTDATLIITSVVGGATQSAYYQGVLTSPNVLTFGGTSTGTQVIFPTTPFQLQVTNVRVNVVGTFPSSLQPVTESVSLIAQGNGLAAVTTLPTVTVGNQRNSLAVTGTSTYTAPGSTSLTGTAASVSPYLVCAGTGTANGSGSQGFVVTVSELFAGAFKIKTQVAPASTAGIPNSESGSFVPSTPPTGVAAGTGTANFGTRIKLIFTGVPANATISVPVTAPNATTGFVANLTSGGETGPFVLATSGTVTNNTAIYEITAADYTLVGGFTVPVTVTYAPGTVVATSTPITVAVSYAPSPATSGGALASPIPTIPYFANTSTTLNGSNFSACQTTLLFPFVTNQANFETGIAIANTGLDNLSSTGTSVATGQSGACKIYFYGSTGAEGGTQPTAPTAANFPSATNKPTTTILPGTTHADTLTDVIGGPFQGYAIAVCPFLYARGFAFIEYGLTTGSGVVEGYLADVISSQRTAFSAFTTTVSNTAPESSGN